MTNPFILLDFDGVLLYFNKALREQLQKAGHNIDTTRSEYYNYKGFSKAEQSIIRDCIDNNVDMYRNLEFFDGALDALKTLQSKIEVRAYTGSVGHKEIYKIRHNLIRELGMKELPIVGKKPVIHGAYALIDDCPSVHRQFIDDNFSGLCFLVDAPYNREMEPEYASKTIRVNNFVEAVHDIVGRLG